MCSGSVGSVGIPSRLIDWTRDLFGVGGPKLFAQLWLGLLASYSLFKAIQSLVLLINVNVFE